MYEISDIVMFFIIFKKQFAFSWCNQVSMPHIRDQQVSPMQSSSWPPCKSTRTPKPTPPPHATRDNRVNGWSTGREVKSTKWGQIYQIPLAIVTDGLGKRAASSPSKHTSKDLEESSEKPEDFEREQLKMLALILLCFSTLDRMLLSEASTHCFIYHWDQQLKK